jgi:hypothetical protein
MKYLVVTEGITLDKAKMEVESAKVKFSEKIYELMNYIVKREEPCILLNRNPTLRKFGVVKIL